MIGLHPRVRNRHLGLHEVADLCVRTDQALGADVLGGIFLLFALPFFVPAMVCGRPDLPPPPGPGVVEGTLDDGPLTAAPLGHRVLYGHLRVDAVQGFGKGRRSRKLLDYALDEARARVSTSAGSVPVELPQFSYVRWRHSEGVHWTIPTLQGTGVEHLVPSWEAAERDSCNSLSSPWCRETRSWSSCEAALPRHCGEGHARRLPACRGLRWARTAPLEPRRGGSSPCSAWGCWPCTGASDGACARSRRLITALPICHVGSPSPSGGRQVATRRQSGLAR